MGTTTTNYAFYKPDPTEFVDVVAQLNDNMDDIDTQLKRVDDAATQPPRVKVVQSNGNPTNLINANWTDVTFNSGTEIFDTHNFHNNAANTEQFVIPSDGSYRVSGKGSIVQNATGSRGIRWLRNGTPVPGTEVMMAAAPDAATGVASAVTTIPCVAGDILKMQMYQSSGANRDTFVGAGDTHLHTFAEIVKVAAT